MISVANLLIENRIPGNYFASDAYVHSDLELGLLENRRGDRLLALPDTMLQAIYAGLEKETGQAGSLVLINCGRWWGKNFYARFCEEVSDYYQAPLSDMPMVEFLQCLRQCWQTHGWGKIDLDQTYQAKGFLVVEVQNSPFIKFALKGDTPVGYLESGVLSSFFSQLTGRDLACVQTSCESQGCDRNRFVLGIPKRLEAIEQKVLAGESHDAIMHAIAT